LSKEACVVKKDVAEKEPPDEREGRRWGRMDFKVEVLSTDDDTRTVRFQLVPDPRRYDRIEHEGEDYYFDKYLRLLIPEAIILGRAAQQLVGLPVYHLSGSIKSSSEYAAARKDALDGELKAGTYVPPSEKAIPHQSAYANSNPRELVFLSVDICGGSALRRADRNKFDRAYKIFMRELGTVVGQFNGTIYKPTGDGFIAYIDHPSFTSRSDQAIDLGLTFLVVLDSSINPSLREAGLPELKIRVGADTGPVSFREIEVPTTGFADVEIASDALNRAVKIQESAEANQFRIGHDLYELIHVQWLERAEEVAFDGQSVGIPGYKTYKVV
jgi:class 3 adenylate cyclase